MARNRMIKPGFWSDQKTGKLSDKSKLIFIGMWNFSDDEGKINGDPMYLRSSILPYFNGNVTKEIDDLLLSRLIVEYSSKGQRYFWISNFNKHQKIDRPQRSQLPNPKMKDCNLRDFLFKDVDGICPDCDREMVFESLGSNPPNPYDEVENSDMYVNGNNSRVFSIDHIKPKDGGGTDTPSNLRALCITCNKKKGSSPLDESQFDEYSTTKDKEEREVKDQREKLKNKERDLESNFNIFWETTKHARRPEDDKASIKKKYKKALSKFSKEDILKSIFAYAENNKGKLFSDGNEFAKGIRAMLDLDNIEQNLKGDVIKKKTLKEKYKEQDERLFGKSESDDEMPFNGTEIII